MAQHDMNIANQGFPAFRSDLNNALSAIVSNSSGATEPSTTVAYQFWADTTNDLLKQRNAANDGWISVLTLSTGEPVTGGTPDKIEEGNSSVEVIDTGTGSVAIVVDGVQTATFNSSGFLGIGDTTPSSPLVVDKSVANNSMQIINTNATGYGALIRGGGASAAYYQLRVQDKDGAASLNINGTGYVGLGTTNPQALLHIDSGDLRMTDGYSIRSGADLVLRRTDTTNEVRLGSGNASDNIVFYAGGGATEKARIDPDGDFNFDSGYGSAATAYGVRAWVNFNGDTISIRDSGNVSSITDLATGKYRINFSTSMPDTNYSVNGMGHEPNDSASEDAAIRLNHTASPMATSYVEVATGMPPTNATASFLHKDVPIVTVAIVR